jgi:hypothetical protein
MCTPMSTMAQADMDNDSDDFPLFTALPVSVSCQTSPAADHLEEDVTTIARSIAASAVDQAVMVVWVFAGGNRWPAMCLLVI